MSSCCGYTRETSWPQRPPTAGGTAGNLSGFTGSVTEKCTRPWCNDGRSSGDYEAASLVCLFFVKFFWKLFSNTKAGSSLRACCISQFFLSILWVSSCSCGTALGERGLGSDASAKVHRRGEMELRGCDFCSPHLCQFWFFSSCDHCVFCWLFPISVGSYFDDLP